MESLSGVGVALVTPFNEEKKVDFGALEKLVDHVISEGFITWLCKARQVNLLLCLMLKRN